MLKRCFINLKVKQSCKVITLTNSMKTISSLLYSSPLTGVAKSFPLKVLPSSDLEGH